MRDELLKLYFRMQNLMSLEEGQDLVEYALVIALIALGATAGMGKLATALSNGFVSIGSAITTSIPMHDA